MHFVNAESRCRSKPAHRRYAPGKAKCDLAEWQRGARSCHSHTVERRRSGCSQSAATAATHGQDFVGKLCRGELHLACRRCHENKIATRWSNFPCTKSNQICDGEIRHNRNRNCSTAVELKRPRPLAWPLPILATNAVCALALPASQWPVR